MNSPKKTRIRFPLAKKIEMLDLAKQGKPRPEICKSYGISPSTLQNFIREEAKLRSEFEKNKNSKRCMIRNSPHYNLEQSIVKWIHIVRDKNVAISGPMVEEIRRFLNHVLTQWTRTFQTLGNWSHHYLKIVAKNSRSSRIFLDSNLPLQYNLGIWNIVTAHLYTINLINAIHAKKKSSHSNAV